LGRTHNKDPLNITGGCEARVADNSPGGKFPGEVTTGSRISTGEVVDVQMLQLPTGVVYQSVLCLLHRPFTVYRMSKKHR